MTARKNHFIVEENTTKLSIAISIKDDFTDVEPIGDVTVSIKGIKNECIRNLTGYYLFTNLPPKLDEVEIRVNSDFYLKVNEVWQITRGSDLLLVEDIRLKPNCAYPFPVQSTLLRAVVQKKMATTLLNKSPYPIAISEANVNVTIYQPESPNTATARLGTGGAVKGSKTIKLNSISSGMSLMVGDVLMIEESNNGNMEFCQIASPLPENPDVEAYNLFKELKFDHTRDKPVFLMKDRIEEKVTRTDEKGEMVLYFKRNKVNRFLIDVTISKEGYQDKKLQKIEITEGISTSLGVVELKSRN